MVAVNRLDQFICRKSKPPLCVLRVVSRQKGVRAASSSTWKAVRMWSAQKRRQAALVYLCYHIIAIWSPLVYIGAGISKPSLGLIQPTLLLQLLVIGTVRHCMGQSHTLIQEGKGLEDAGSILSSDGNAIKMCETLYSDSIILYTWCFGGVSAAWFQDYHMTARSPLDCSYSKKRTLTLNQCHQTLPFELACVPQD